MKLFSVVNLSRESPQSDSIILSPDVAVSKIKSLLADGSDYVDIGGRSSGSITKRTNAKMERQRLAPVFQLTKQNNISPLSLDTWSITTALKYINHIDVLNYTSTLFTDRLLCELMNTQRKLIISYLPAANPYQLRRAPCVPFDINRMVLYFEKTLAMLCRRGVNVLAIDPNLGMWHPSVADADKPRIQCELIEHLAVLKKLAPVFIVAPRRAGALNIELTKTILNRGVDFIRTHDLKQVQALIAMRSGPQDIVDYGGE